MLLAQTWWQDRVLRGVAEYASRHDWELDCRMHWTHRLPDRGDWQGDGIIAFAGASRSHQRARKQLAGFVRRARVPVVETQAFGSLCDAPKVVVRHEDIGRLAAEHFLRLNFRHLGYVTFDENPLEAHRRTAYRRTVEEAGAVFHALSARTLWRRLPYLPRPMGLFAANDANALEVVHACLATGTGVPEEFAVLGADDTEIICNFAAVPLSSINCNFEQLGYEAAALLDRLMSGAPRPSAPVAIAPRGVTVRRSTDTLAIPDLDTARLLRHLRDHFRDGRSVQQMADDLGVRLRQVTGAFRNHVGHTVLQELNRLRVSHAQSLLRGTRQKLDSVARESGFGSRFHFVRAFQRVVGETPSAWRRRHRPATPASGPLP